MYLRFDRSKEVIYYTATKVEVISGKSHIHGKKSFLEVLDSPNRLEAMQLQDEDIREFSELWKQEFKETLSMEEARHHASLLMELYGVLARPLPEERTDSPDTDSTSN